MDNWKTETDDRELERLFAEARRYPLLSAEQERDIDASKWRAVDDLCTLFTDSEGGRRYLQDLLARIQHEPPEVANFANRDHHFLLRRELVSYLSGGEQVASVTLLASALSAGDLAAARDTIKEMALPASLAVGMAVTSDRSNAGLLMHWTPGRQPPKVANRLAHATGWNPRSSVRWRSRFHVSTRPGTR